MKEIIGTLKAQYTRLTFYKEKFGECDMEDIEKTLIVLTEYILQKEEILNK